MNVEAETRRVSPLRSTSPASTVRPDGAVSSRSARALVHSVTFGCAIAGLADRL